MAYTLEQARTDLKSRLPFLTRAVDMSMLDGIFDGAQTLFHLPIVPASETGLVIYDDFGAPTTSFTVISYEAGSIRFDADAIPSVPMYATYTALLMSDAKLLLMCGAGFDEMQSRYARPYYLLESGGTTSISSDSSTVVDPVIGSLTFSTSRAQVDFLLGCIEYKLLQALASEAAYNAISYREERVGGLAVDRTKQPGAYEFLLEQAAQHLDEKMWTARNECDETGFGQFIPGAQSNTYADTYDWWTDSRQATGR